MKRSPILLVFVIAALLDAVERTSASVISFQLLLSGDVEENPGPGLSSIAKTASASDLTPQPFNLVGIDYERVDTKPLGKNYIV